MRIQLERFARDESGATTVVYGLIAAGMVLAIITAMSCLGSKLNATFTWVQTVLE